MPIRAKEGSLRNLFRRKTVLDLKDTSNSKEKEFIRDISAVCQLRLRLTSKSKFRVVENLTLFPPSATLELVDYPGHVLRSRGTQLTGEKKVHEKNFRDDSTFFLMSDLWFDGFIAFESVKKVAHYIRLSGNDLELARYDGTASFKEECSFKMQSTKCSRVNNIKFQNNWIEENGSIGLQLNTKSSISPKLSSPSTKDNKFLMVPTVSQDETSSKPDLYEKEDNMPGRRNSVTFRKKQLLSKLERQNFLPMCNDAFEDSPVSSQRLSLRCNLQPISDCSEDECNESAPNYNKRSPKALGNELISGKAQSLVQDDIEEFKQWPNSNSNINNASHVQRYNEAIFDNTKEKACKPEEPTGIVPEQIQSYIDTKIQLTSTGQRRQDTCENKKYSIFEEDQVKLETIQLNKEIPVSDSINSLSKEHSHSERKPHQGKNERDARSRTKFEELRKLKSEKCRAEQFSGAASSSFYLYCLADDNDFQENSNNTAEIKVKRKTGVSLNSSVRPDSGISARKYIVNKGSLTARRVENGSLL
eukprot:gene4962-5608_t